ncbi:Uncharacterised protein [Sphingobacterium multivorum]|nr:Uncharacterised protein [Sphingobacterium multivorum]
MFFTVEEIEKKYNVLSPKYNTNLHSKEFAKTA